MFLPRRFNTQYAVTQSPNSALSLDQSFLMPMSEGAGTVANDLYMVHPGTINGTVSWGASPFGACLKLDGSTTGVKTANNFTPVTNGGTVVGFSAFIWANFTSFSGGYQMLFSQEDGAGGFNWEILVNPSNDLALYFNTGNTDPISGALTAKVWNHIGFTFGRVGNTRMWLNGQIVGTMGGIGGPAIGTAAQKILVGGGSSFANRFCTGSVWGASIWSRELTAPEVQRLYISPMSLYAYKPNNMIFTTGTGPGGTGYVPPRETTRIIVDGELLNAENVYSNF